MNPIKLLTDGYERKARLYPALLVLAPILVVFGLVLPAGLTALQVAGSVLVSCGGALLLAQVARNAGKRQEKALFALWGGMPSMAIFRHRDTRIDPITKAGYHKKLATLVRDAAAPSEQEEADNPVTADQVYAAWSTYIRTKTRDTKTYSLLFRENVNYGYCRNLYGLRPIGITTSILAVGISGFLLYAAYAQSGTVSVEHGTAVVIALIMLSLWVFHFTTESAWIPAEAYAERLAEAVDTLEAPMQGGAA